MKGCVAAFLAVPLRTHDLADDLVKRALCTVFVQIDADENVALRMTQIGRWGQIYFSAARLLAV